MCINKKNGDVYVAGNFTNGSGNRYVAKFNGSNWTELGGANSLAANGIINSITIDKEGYVYAVGNFTNSSGKSYVAKFNGTSWIELGGVNSLAPNGQINTICADATSNIFIGGLFKNIINNEYVAEYSCKTDTINFFQTRPSDSQIIFGGQTLHSAGNYIDTLQNYNGCDSLIILHLTTRPTGVSSISNYREKIKIYPNPTNQSLVVSQQEIISKIEIINIFGEIIFTQTPSYKTQHHSVDVSNLNCGIYFIKVTDNKGNSINSKFIKR